MSNNESDDAEERKKKLEVLRAKRLDQDSAQQVITGDEDSGGKQGGMRDRLKKALVKRRQAGGEAGTATTTRGLKEMSAGNDSVPRKKGAMKKRAMKKMAMKKMAMKKRAMKKRGGGQRAEGNKVDASSTLEQISKQRGFLEERINKLQSALNDRTAELKEVVALEAEKSKEK